jgi:hypothetical protein
MANLIKAGKQPKGLGKRGEEGMKQDCISKAGVLDFLNLGELVNLFGITVFINLEC